MAWQAWDAAQQQAAEARRAEQVSEPTANPWAVQPQEEITALAHVLRCPDLHGSLFTETTNTWNCAFGAVANRLIAAAKHYHNEQGGVPDVPAPLIGWAEQMFSSSFKGWPPRRS